MSAVEHDDAALVTESLGGNRDAFEHIVVRYQSLVCALAYSATGSLSESEDLAQETFVTAWQHLSQLREPAKLRTWLCGIARNRIGKALRQARREPAHAAEPLETLARVPASELQPPDHAITKEEEAILWCSLERIPENYREPLVLYYRQHQSIERVAQELELSEDAVKQRLSRGRKLLHEQVLAFVEGALERTSPGKAFTVAVLAALPASVPQAAMAGVMATAAKGLTVAKSAATAGVVGTILGPAIGLLGAWFGVRASIRNTRSPRERRFMIRAAWLCGGLVALSGLVMWGIIYFGRSLTTNHRGMFFGLILACVLMYGAALLWLISWGNRKQRQIQIEDGTCAEPSAPLAGPTGLPNPAAVYGGLGGSIVGGTAWLVVAAIRAHDWLGAGGVALVAGALFIVSTRVCQRRRERYFSVLVWVCVALGAVTLTLSNLRWSAWFGYDPQFRHWSALSLSAVVVLLYGVVTVILWSRCKRVSGSPPSGAQ